MADLPGTPIISIYDLVRERKIFLACKGVQQKSQPESEPIAETIRDKSKAISKSISEYLNCSSDGDLLPPKPSNVLASHLTRKRTGVVMQQQQSTNKKEVLDNKLPQKIAPRTTNSRTSSVVENNLNASTSKSLTSTGTKKKSKKIQPSKANLIDQPTDQRMPMSPRKAGGENQPRIKTTAPLKLNLSKASQTKLRPKGRKSKVCLINPIKTPTTPSSGVPRWRL